MDSQFISPISIEKFAAYLDDNLPEPEMQEVEMLIGNIHPLQQMVEANAAIDEALAFDTIQTESLPEEIEYYDFKIPDLNDINNIDEFNILNHTTMATTNYGETGLNVKDPIFIQQPDDHSCALRSQQIVLRDFGIDVPFEELEKIALEADVYTDQGTRACDIGKVLEMAGVPVHQTLGNTAYDLVNELASGHRVIVSVDANELWYNDTIFKKSCNWLADVMGNQGGNHALIVAGVEVDPDHPSNSMVVLTDPGAGDLRIEYPMDQFMDAWQDSNCFMVATDQPAPFQYDHVTGMEVPSNFIAETHYNQWVMENSYQLSPDAINIPTDYQPYYASGHLDTIGDVPYPEFEDKYDRLQAARFGDDRIDHQISDLVNDLKNLFHIESNDPDPDPNPIPDPDPDPIPDPDLDPISDPDLDPIPDPIPDPDDEITDNSDFSF